MIWSTTAISTYLLLDFPRPFSAANLHQCLLHRAALKIELARARPPPSEPASLNPLSLLRLVVEAFRVAGRQKVQTDTTTAASLFLPWTTVAARCCGDFRIGSWEKSRTPFGQSCHPFLHASVCTRASDSSTHIPTCVCTEAAHAAARLTSYYIYTPRRRLLRPPPPPFQLSNASTRLHPLRALSTPRRLR